MEKLVVIGSGMASGRALEHLLDRAPGAYEITVINAEPRGTYNRIMLTPVLSGEKSYDEIVTHDAAWYERHGVTCRFGERVTEIDRAARIVRLGADEIPYDKLVIATGSSPFIPPVPGRDLDGVMAYRDLDDTETMIAAAQTKGARAVVIGGGLLGLEAAAGLRLRGMEVTILHLSGHLMDRQLDATAGDLLRQDLERRGIAVRTGARTAGIAGDTHAEAVRLEDGTEIPADLVVMSAGIRPATGLARDAGLAVERGIVVDDRMATSDPAILAVGECVEHDGAVFGLVAPLYDQAKVLAATLAGDAAAFVQKRVSTKLKVTGVGLFSAGDFAEGDDREDIVYRDPNRGVYKRLVIENDRLIGAVMYGETADSAWFYALITAGEDISGMRETLIFGPAYQEPPASAEQPLSPEARADAA